MKLRITTPGAIVVDEDDIASLRAEDETGSFGVLERHADFLTVLTLSVVSWRRGDGEEGFCAVRGGILTVRNGSDIEIATREAVVSNDLDQMEHVVVSGFQKARESAQAEHAAAAQMEMRAIQRIVRYLRAPNSLSGGGGP